MISVTIDGSVLDAVMPMALVFDRDGGQIQHVGPMLRRIAPGLKGRSLAETIALRRTTGPVTPESLLAHAGRRLVLDLAGQDGSGPTRLRGMALPLQGTHGLLTLSFGPDVADAVRRHNLDSSDFSSMDPTIEVLFLVEARDAVLAELVRLGDRLSEARDAAEVRAQTDNLTGLPNRRALDHVLRRLVKAPAPRFGVMHLDLDHFKQVNDTLGHAAGDLVLERVAKILTEEVRNGDLVARVGGDEFVLVFPDCVDVSVLVRIGERIIERLQQPISFGSAKCQISGSAGVTLSSFYSTFDLDRVLGDADRALYVSKEAGRSQVRVADPCLE